MCTQKFLSWKRFVEDFKGIQVLGCYSSMDAAIEDKKQFMQETKWLYTLTSYQTLLLGSISKKKKKRSRGITGVNKLCNIHWQDDRNMHKYKIFYIDLVYFIGLTLVPQIMKGKVLNVSLNNYDFKCTSFKFKKSTVYKTLILLHWQRKIV